MRTLVDALKMERASGRPGGVYQTTQILFAYNSNRIEGGRLSLEQNRDLLKKRAIKTGDGFVRADDVLTALNHFRCLDIVIDECDAELSEDLVKRLHAELMRGTSASEEAWFAVGEYKRVPNIVGGMATTHPRDVPAAMRNLVADQNANKEPAFDDLLDYHARFERVHPFQDGNGRVGRLLLFRESLRHGLTPFFILDAFKEEYYVGLRTWQHDRTALRDTCVRAREEYGALLKKFGVTPRRA